MKNISGSTPSEDRMCRAVQAAIGSYVDGSWGAQTVSDIAIAVGADCFPLAIDIYSQPCIIAHDLRPAMVSAPLRNYADAISGSFVWKGKPCSILVCDGSALSTAACHYWISGTPESVLYRTLDGKYGIRRCCTVSDLPSGVKWAIGGLGLLDNYDPVAEGFVGQYADAIRRTNHTLVGVKRGMVYLCYAKSKTGAEVNAFAKKMGFDYAVMLDGGSQAAINSVETKINTGTVQYYIVQAI